MSMTPLTDAAQAQNIKDAFGEKGYQSPWDRMRELERQLNAERTKHKEAMEVAKEHVQFLVAWADAHPDAFMHSADGMKMCAARQWLQEQGE